MSTTLKFGDCQFHPGSGELIARGARLRLEPQPARVLAVLASRAGEVVTREELRREVWPADVFVDFERGLAYCIRRVRQALGDSAGAPRFIETLPKRGYRFLPAVEIAGDPGSAAEPAEAAGPSAQSGAGGLPLAGAVAPATVDREPGWWRRRRLARTALAAAVAVAVAVGAAAAVAFSRGRSGGGVVPTVAVTLFDNQTGRPEMDRQAQVLTDVLVERLAAGDAGRFSVIGNAPVLRLPRPFRNLPQIAGSLHADLIVLGQIVPGEETVTVLTHLIRARDQRHVWVGRFAVPPAVPAVTIDRICGQVADAVARQAVRLR